MYNLFSIINVLNEKRLDDYWCRSGNPAFLAKLIGGNNINMEKLLARSYSAPKFIDYWADIFAPLAMLYESGYITVKDYDSIGRYFWFDYPNAEVRGRFSTLVANDYYGKDVEFVSWA